MKVISLKQQTYLQLLKGKQIINRFDTMILNLSKKHHVEIQKPYFKVSQNRSN